MAEKSLRYLRRKPSYIQEGVKDGSIKVVDMHLHMTHNPLLGPPIGKPTQTFSFRPLTAEEVRVLAGNPKKGEKVSLDTLNKLQPHLAKRYIEFFVERGELDYNDIGPKGQGRLVNHKWNTVYDFIQEKYVREGKAVPGEILTMVKEYNRIWSEHFSSIKSPEEISGKWLNPHNPDTKVFISTWGAAAPFVDDDGRIMLWRKIGPLF